MDFQGQTAEWGRDVEELWPVTFSSLLGHAEASGAMESCIHWLRILIVSTTLGGMMLTI